MLRSVLALTLGVAATATAACDRRDLDDVGEEGTPLVVVVSPAHAESAPEASLERLEGLLRDETGIALEVTVADSAGAAIRAFEHERADVGLLPLFDYLLCRAAYGAEPVLRVLRRGGSPHYTGEILVRAGSQVRELEDLEGARVALVDEHSVSGFVLPMSLLSQHGVDVDPVIAGSHAAALERLRRGDVVAAATYAGVAEAAPALRVVTETHRVPNEPVFVRPGLDAELGDAIASAIAGVAESDEGRAVLADLADITGVEPIDADAYQAVSEHLTRIGKRIQDVVPGGWTIYNENRRSLAREFGP